MGIITSHPEREDGGIEANHGCGCGEQQPVTACLVGFDCRKLKPLGLEDGPRSLPPERLQAEKTVHE
jgi:hypothetical protein